MTHTESIQQYHSKFYALWIFSQENTQSVEDEMVTKHNIAKAQEIKKIWAKYIAIISTLPLF